MGEALMMYTIKPTIMIYGRSIAAKMNCKKINDCFIISMNFGLLRFRVINLGGMGFENYRWTGALLKEVLSGPAYNLPFKLLKLIF